MVGFWVCAITRKVAPICFSMNEVAVWMVVYTRGALGVRVLCFGFLVGL